MDETRLAHDVVDKLSPFLKGLLAKHPMPSSDNPPELEANALWKVIYPKVALRSGVMRAAGRMAQEDSPENREALSKQLALVFRTNSFLAAEVQEYLTTENTKIPSDPKIANVKPSISMSRPGTIDQEFGAEQITCLVCGRQDETLRLVSYPFVFSLVVVTFRRMFQGVYCSRHANRYFFLAVCISLTFGWLGIPFGLIFTPITLFNLFASEKRLRPANAKLLMEIAKAKQEKGSMREAAVFLQESLWLDDDPPIIQQTQKVVAGQVAAEKPALVSQVFSLVSGFTAAWLTGFLIGLVAGLFSSPFNTLEGQISILVIIFSYIPLVLMLYFGGFVLARFIRWMLERTLISSRLSGRLVAGFATLTAFYAILTGNMFFFEQVNGGQGTASLMDAIRINGALAVHGGWLTFARLIQYGSTADLLFVVLTIFGLMMFFWLGQDWANRTIRWRKALREIQKNEHQGSGLLVGLSAILIVGTVFVLLGLIFSLPANFLK